MVYKEKICGIYCIENILNGKKYIGQSIDIKGRFANHKSNLNRNIHINQYLQFSWNKYGIDNFKFYIIEKCDESLLNEREIYWINFYGTEKSDNLYNIAEGGYQNPYSGYSKEEQKILHAKQAESHRRGGKSKGGKNSFAKKVICLNTGEIFDCATDADKYYNLIHSVAECARGDTKSAGTHPITNEKLQWAYYEEGKDYKIKEYIHNRYRKVICLNNKMIFDSVTQACEWCNIKGGSNIAECCKGKRNYVGKHPETKESLDWMYYDDYLKYKGYKKEFISNYKKQVRCINTGEIFESVNAVCRWLSVTPNGNISKCCRGEKDYFGKHPITGEKLKWEYFEC